MGRKIRLLFVGAGVLMIVGAAAANQLLHGPSPGLAVQSTQAAPSQPAATTPTTTTGAPAITTGPSVGVPGPAITTEPTTTATAQATTGTAPGTPTATGTLPVIDRIVALTRTLEPGTAPVSVFTVPAGQQLVLTDVLVTNPGTTATCGAAIGVGGAATAGTTVVAPGTTTAPDATGATGAIGVTAAEGVEPGTGLLCVSAQTSLNLGLTTGLEFTGGQSVTFANVATAGATGAPLHYHARGVLLTPGS